MDEIRKHVVRGITQIKGVVADEAAVERIVLKIRERTPADKANYAYVAGMNWAKDEVRRRNAAPRVTQRKLERQVSELERKVADMEAEQCKARCLTEFETVSARILPDLKATQPKHLAVLRASVFDGWTYELMQSFFEGSRDCIHQWKRRGIRLVWPHISKEFRDFLGVQTIP